MKKRKGMRNQNKGGVDKEEITYTIRPAILSKTVTRAVLTLKCVDTLSPPPCSRFLFISLAPPPPSPIRPPPRPAPPDRVRRNSRRCPRALLELKS
jgi:hypothetical protein